MYSKADAQEREHKTNNNDDKIKVYKILFKPNKNATEKNVINDK